ncbi:MAG: helix-turn-helix domain-containing protein [Pseudonocardiaceae bacterium]
MTVRTDHEGPVSGLVAARIRLGSQLAGYRADSKVSQERVGQAAGCSRHLIGLVEHGKRALTPQRWRLVDDFLGARGALVAAAEKVARAAEDERKRRRDATRRARAEAVLDGVGRPGASGQSGLWVPTVDKPVAEQLEELARVLKRLTDLVGRRDAIALGGQVLAAVGVAGLDEDEIIRIAHAVAAPGRVDNATVTHLRHTLRTSQALEDQLGPQEVIAAVMAQLSLVRGLLEGGVPDVYYRPLQEMAARIAAVLGGYYVNLLDYERARICFRYARRKAHVAQSPACGAQAAAKLTWSHFLAGDVVSALDCAQVTLGLGSQTPDLRVKAFSAEMAAAAYAANGQHRDCMRLHDRAKDLLARAGDADSADPLYWLSDGIFDGQQARYLLALHRPKDALGAVMYALDGIPESYVQLRGFSRVIRGRAMLATQEIDSAAHELAEAISVAHLAPRLAADLLAARTELQRWRQRDSVRALDEQLAASGMWIPAPSRQRHDPR